MKSIVILTGLLSLVASSVFATEARQITIETKKIGDVMHWTPEKIEVTQGEAIEIIATHSLKGGFDIHGLRIPVLKVTEQVTRNAPVHVRGISGNLLRYL